MTKILINGCSGRLGSIVENSIKDKELEVVCGVDLKINSDSEKNYNIYDDIYKIEEDIDVIVDFSSDEGTKKSINYALENNKILIIGTTGLSDETLKLIKKASSEIPIFYTSNFSIGVSVVKMLLLDINDVLLNYDYNVSIYEKHHVNKKDKPSGTALMLAKVIDKEEIDVYSEREGNVVGEHKVVFENEDEIIELNHIAKSKKLFGDGVICAIKFMINKQKGLYGMGHLIDIWKKK